MDIQNGVLKEDYHFGHCLPSLADRVVANQSIDGWTAWKNVKGQPINIYRKKKRNG